MRLAAIDCGTNSLHLLIVHMDDDGRFDVVYDIKDTPRLGEGVTRTSVLSREAQSRAIQTLKEYREICNRFGVERSRAVATSAVRRSLNQADFAHRVSKETGFELEILSGSEEARLVALACSHEPGFAEGPYILFNVGGGSTELVLGQGRELREARSAEVGAVILSERFLRSDPPKRSEIEAMEKHIKSELKKTLPPKLVNPSDRVLYGSGGTVMNLLQMKQVLRFGAVLSGTFFQLPFKAVREMYLSLVEKKVAQRKSTAGLNPNRADIIVGGAGVVKTLMETYGFKELITLDKGLKYGVVVEESIRVKQNMFRTILALASRPLEEAETPEIRHALKVRDLSLEIFDALSAHYRFDPSDRNLLALSALLHDIGLSVEMRSHHKHSYELIQRSELLKLPGRERDMVALIARYHRKAFPSEKHEAYARLDRADRQRVERLAGIVRLADGFDRSHSQAVDALHVRFDRKTVTLKPVSGRVSTLDCLGGQSKKDLFEKAFERRVIVENPWTEA
ncbi:MAG: Ppx/GppA family phosphatase [Candidatus Wallbacteria bacterium]|nr:Ppx/GppA family phosphatase [Candidatus Wallbacteria bacterium]